MEKRKNQRVLAILIACVMLFALPLSASAKAMDGVEETSIEMNATQPRSFDKTYDVSLGFGFSSIMSDDNWWGEPKVKVKFTDAFSTGPQKIKVYVKDKNGNKSSEVTLMENGYTTFDIPAGKFSVWACAVDRAGSAQITVSLSW